MSDDELELGGSLFEEPEGFLPPPPSHRFSKYERKTPKQPKDINLRLVGSSPLWGHYLWNAGIYTADYLDNHSVTLVQGKRVLELGAAAGLPSIICGQNGADFVLCTDYPDPDLISNIDYNVRENNCTKNTSVKGYIWGDDVSELVYGESGKELKEEDKFDLIILSDLVFNHTEHLKLLKTCRLALKKTGKCFVVFSPHRPKLLQNDLDFFETCTQFEFKSVKNDLVIWKPMFDEDEETVEIRSRVYSFFLHPQW